MNHFPLYRACSLIAIAGASALPALASGEAVPACRSVLLHSSPHPPVLVELYTSEGCSSCPPADRWLGGLQASGLPRKAVLPLAFHVDYWDYIGWQDRFASAAYSQRQRARAALGGAAFVYTPQLLVDGRDNRNWHQGYAALHAARPARTALMQLQLQAAAGGVAVEVDVQQAGKGQLYLALYEDKLDSQVKAGENSGLLLQHHAVVRQLLGPFNPAADGHLHRSVQLAFAPGQKPQYSGVAAWLEDGADGQVLQALSADCNVVATH
ncbi:hypothetical protein IGB42_00104 [Andreprevotia sp. IGB-42]|uniref:DUF1223 domain-containing protein n=1 Tax=Andreprevotia sp. IGB-42 TaxID=2497473 RepID=UPI00135790E0|nr:DUF1223 domain-containing protein [Andreprevotia sp. IGB-42]KAF0815027.1 hypothetical protein IGB42_00104 [Andreprevotia sp. IGB-42]